VALPASPETSAEPQEHGLAAISTFSPLVSYPAPTAVPGGRLLTVAEVAEALKLTRDGVYFHIRSGRLKAVQSGALLHVRPEDLAEFNATARRRRS
jgi:excisionase family DNA binding protein